ncbi:GDP-L-fucose synthase family protein [Sphaerochaeta sp.]|uniref:GDP-L-fucose synthase family protein n=1 Tax=Sphaerochaeta sp. TaxID=1972642 RepID=UPI002FC5A92A
MEKEAKIYVAGHNGMVGSSLVRELNRQGYSNLLLRTSKDLDLRQQNQVEDFFEMEKPDYVFLAAAKVGGIMANSTYPADFMYDNIMMEMNVIHSAWKYHAKKLLFLGSSCIYPKLASQPIKEESLLTSALEPTNEAYALAKISGLKYCEYLNRQHGTDFISAMPTNLYGPNDNYHPQNSHVLPALLRRFHEAKVSNSPSVTIWGTGTPLREFLYVDDLAEACVFLMNIYHGSETVNIGTGKELSIKELAYQIKRVIGYEGKVLFDDSKPDGTPRKLLDVSKLTQMGWSYKTELEVGIRLAYEDYLSHAIRTER